ncbi:MAG: hypothetical protein ACLVBP_09860 [Ruminococcus sp.]
MSFGGKRRLTVFAANDTLPIEFNSESGSRCRSKLDEMELLEMYDVIYYLYCTGRYSTEGLRLLYKYEYYLTKQEKKTNPSWGDFIAKMNIIYGKNLG